MFTRSIRNSLALLALLVLVGSARPVRADTFTGTVGLIRVFGLGPNVAGSYVAFKLTDAALATGCKYDSGAVNANPPGTPPADHLVVSAYGNFHYREIYAMLLVSKKGAPIVCETAGAKAQVNGCLIRSCELP